MSSEAKTYRLSADTEPHPDAISTTNHETRGNHTFAPRSGPSAKFGNGREAFNALSPMPSNFIDLGDGRVLCISRWMPDGDKTLYGGAAHLPITIEGFITLKDKQ